MSQAEHRNRELQDQIHRSQRQDTNTQDVLETRELEVASLKKALKDLEQKAKVRGNELWIVVRWLELSFLVCLVEIIGVFL